MAGRMTKVNIRIDDPTARYLKRVARLANTDVPTVVQVLLVVEYLRGTFLNRRTYVERTSSVG